MCISKVRGLTDAPSQWTQWITYRSLSQTRLRWPLVYPTLIGPSAEVALAFTRCSLQRRNQKLICKGGVSLLIKNIRTSENCLCVFVRAAPHERSCIQVCITMVVKRKEKKSRRGVWAQTQIDLGVGLKRKSSGGCLVEFCWRKVKVWSHFLRFFVITVLEISGRQWKKVEDIYIEL